MKASLIMIDCDLYSSAKEALDFIGPLVREEAIVFFDDWHAGQLHEKDMGEKRAFDEFLVANPHFVWNELPDLRYNYNSKVFYVARQGRGV